MSSERLLMLYGKANALCEREVTVTETKDGKHIVEFMSFSDVPPPKGETEEEALELFVEYMLKRRNDGSSISKDDSVSTKGELDGENNKSGA